MACLICGNAETVRSHIFPRQLMHDVKKDDNFLNEISVHRGGRKFLQSGPVDRNILCAAHEALTQAPDHYATEFCRRVNESMAQAGEAEFIDNPQPEKLVRFAELMVWRFCASSNGRGMSALGPYEARMRSCIFEEVAPDLPLFIARNHLVTPEGLEAAIAIAPFPVRLAERRFWHFMVGGVQFYLKLDSRPLSDDLSSAAANDSNPVRVSKLPPMEPLNVPLLKSVMANALKKRSP